MHEGNIGHRKQVIAFDDVQPFLVDQPVAEMLDPMYRLALRFCGNPTDAEDAAHDTLLNRSFPSGWEEHDARSGHCLIGNYHLAQRYSNAHYRDEVIAIVDIQRCVATLPYRPIVQSGL